MRAMQRDLDDARDARTRDADRAAQSAQIHNDEMSALREQLQEGNGPGGVCRLPF